MKVRMAVATLSIGGAALVGLLLSEGWCGSACIPVPGDVPTLGFGTTKGVKMGDTTTPTKALARSFREVQAYEGAVRQCVKVPLFQHEYDAATQLAYNIGTNAFCASTVVKRFNALDYAGACDAFRMWNKVQGRVVQGLVNRREKERALCLGL